MSKPLAPNTQMVWLLLYVSELNRSSPSRQETDSFFKKIVSGTSYYHQGYLRFFLTSCMRWGRVCVKLWRSTSCTPLSTRIPSKYFDWPWVVLEGLHPVLLRFLSIVHMGNSYFVMKHALEFKSMFHVTCEMRLAATSDSTARSSIPFFLLFFSHAVFQLFSDRDDRELPSWHWLSQFHHISNVV